MEDNEADPALRGRAVLGYFEFFDLQATIHILLIRKSIFFPGVTRLASSKEDDLHLIS